MKKTIAGVLALILVLTLVPSMVFAVDATVKTAAELTDALASADSTINIKLGADIDAGTVIEGATPFAFFTVPTSKTVELDLNGFKLEGTRGTGSTIQNTAIILVDSGATLTVKDGSTNKDGKIAIDSLSDHGWNSAVSAIIVYGTLVVESGIVENTGITSMSYAIDVVSGGGNAATATINGGSILSHNYIAIRQFANSDANQNTLNIKGGTIFGYRRGVWIQQPNTNPIQLATLNIDGGSITAKEKSAVFLDLMGIEGVAANITGGTFANNSNDHPTLNVGSDITTAGGASVTISGGTFTNGGTGGNVGNTNTASTISVSGGTFNVVPTGFLTPDANVTDSTKKETELQLNVNPTYTITIPTGVDFGTLDKNTGMKSEPFEVKATDVLTEQDGSIEVKVTSDSFLLRSGTASIPYSLFNVAEGGTALETDALFATFNGNDTKTGRVQVDTSKITYAGNFKGIMSFKISYVAAP